MMIAVALIAMLAFDAIWLSLMKPRYASLVERVQHKPLRMRYFPAAMAYVAMAIALAFLILPSARSAPGPRWARALRYGGLFGLLAYGIFNATNAAIFEDYDWRVALIDTAWGATLFSIVTYIALL